MEMLSYLERRRKFQRFCFLPVEQMPPNVWPYGVKGRKIGYSDEEAEVQEAGDDLAFLDGEFVENETQDFI